MKKNSNKFVALSQNEMMEIEGGVQLLSNFFIRKTVQLFGKLFK